jgi:hypothetical protein
MSYRLPSKRDIHPDRGGETPNIVDNFFLSTSIPSSSGVHDFISLPHYRTGFWNNLGNGDQSVFSLYISVVKKYRLIRGR